MNSYHSEKGMIPIASASTQNCPYPHHSGACLQNPLASAPHEKFPVTNCAEPDCLQPVFICPACGAGNRALAKFCRNCRQTISYEETLAQLHADLEITQKALTKGARQVLLARLQGAPITALESAWGYLVFAATGWGLGVLANTRMNPPRLLYHFELAEGEEITAFYTLAPETPRPVVLAASRHALYAITLLPGVACKCFFRVSEPGWQIESTLLVRTKAVVRLYHPKTKAYRWLVLEDLQGNVKTLALHVRGAIGAMLGAPDAEKFYFAMEAEILQFDLRENKEQRYAAPGYGLNVKVRPQRHPSTGEIFWHGLEGLVYRFKPEAGNATLKAYGSKRYDTLHFFSSVYDDYLYLLTPENLVLLDYPNGAEIWSFAEEVKAKIQFGRAAPRQFGNYMLLAFRSPSSSGSEERVGLFSLTKRTAPLLLHPAVAASPMPIGGVSNVIAVRKSQPQEKREQSGLLLFQV